MEKEIELWKEPSLILREQGTFICEMSLREHSILCGMLRTCKPSKVLEIGIAEGGDNIGCCTGTFYVEKSC
jgi:hypothetical protein